MRLGEPSVRRADHSSSDRIARMSREQHKRCLGCGYILDGLPENRCPECGRRFHPDDPATFLVWRESGRTYLRVAFAGALAMATPTILLRRLIPPGLNVGSVGLGILWGLGLLAELSVIIAGIIVLTRPRHRSEHRSLIALAVALGSIVIAGCVLVAVVL
jgi:hypothetical protein